MKPLRRIAYVIAFLPAVLIYPAELYPLPHSRKQSQKLPLFAIILTAIYWLFLLAGITLIAIAYATR